MVPISESGYIMQPKNMHHHGTVRADSRISSINPLETALFDEEKYNLGKLNIKINVQCMKRCL